MALKRLTHERYARLRIDGKFDEYTRALAERAGELPPLVEPKAAPALSDDLPPIKPEHPSWWQVQRVERDEHGIAHVSIFEAKDEDSAMRVCMAQKWRCRLVKWGDKRQPFQNFKPIKVVSLDAAEQCLSNDGQGRR